MGADGQFQQNRGQRNQRKEVQDGQPTGVRPQFRREAAARRTAILRSLTFERVAGEPPAVAARGFAVHG